MLHSKILGCLLGGAVGDAMGMPFEEMPMVTRKNLYGDKTFTELMPGLPYKLRQEKVPAGSVTDDTEMTLVTVESILDNQAVIVGDIAGNLSKWIKRQIPWLRGSAQNRNIGPTTRKALEECAKGKSFKECGKESSGCGAAVRISPVGLCCTRDLDLLKRAVFSVARITHKNTRKPLAEEGALCVAASVRHLANGGDPNALIDHLDEVVTTSDFKEQLTKIRDGLREGWTLSIASEELGTGASYLATEVVGIAIFIFLKHYKSFEDAIISAANIVSPSGADTDSIGSIVGTLSGCYLGAGHIPQRWEKKVEYKDKLKTLSRGLFKLISASHGNVRFDE